jgi:hypothetical protein
MYAVLLRGLIKLEQDLKKTHDFAASRLERDAKRRGTTADLLLAWILEVLGVEDIKRPEKDLWHPRSRLPFQEAPGEAYRASIIR